MFKSLTEKFERFVKALRLVPSLRTLVSGSKVIRFLIFRSGVKLQPLIKSALVEKNEEK
jgi:hypothetical protein